MTRPTGRPLGRPPGLTAAKVLKKLGVPEGQIPAVKQTVAQMQAKAGEEVEQGLPTRLPDEEIHTWLERVEQHKLTQLAGLDFLSLQLLAKLDPLKFVEQFGKRLEFTVAKKSRTEIDARVQTQSFVAITEREERPVIEHKP